MSFRRPLFFLLVDSWLVLAGGAGVAALAGCVVVRRRRSCRVRGRRCRIRCRSSCRRYQAGHSDFPELQFPPSPYFRRWRLWPRWRLAAIQSRWSHRRIRLRASWSEAPLRAAVETSGLVFRKAHGSLYPARTVGRLFLLHSRDGCGISGRNRDAKFDELILRVARERRERIILHDPAVILARQFRCARPFHRSARASSWLDPPGCRGDSDSSIRSGARPAAL